MAQKKHKTKKAAAKAPKKKRAAAKKRRGKKAGKPTSRPRRWLRRMLLALVLTPIVIVLAVVGAFFLFRYAAPPATPLMLLRTWQDGAAIEYDWRPLENISPELALAVLAAEDQRYFDHGGFDTKELRHALADHLEGEPLRGASTITQQTVKNVFLWPSRSWVRKGLEFMLTPLAERIWGKRRTLELYLNIAEWGEGVYGAEAAAQAHFNVSADALTREQAAALASVLPNPRAWNPSRPNAKARAKQRWIRKQMHNLGGTRFLAPLYR